MEYKALTLAHLEQGPTHSLKPYFGHTLGAVSYTHLDVYKRQQVYKEIRALCPVFREDTPKYKEIESMMVYLKKGRFQEK